MKSALKTRLKGPNWVHELTWALLGIRTAPKTDLGTSSAELMYGYPITVPGEFLTDGKNATSPAEILPRLRDMVSKFLPTPTTRHGTFKSEVPRDLANAPFVFIRRGGPKPPLQTPYEGPSRVEERGDKTFKVESGNKMEIVSVDRLKPAHLDLDNPVVTAQPPFRGRPQKKEEMKNA